MNYIKTIFNKSKPVIAMCHLKPLPNDISFDEKLGINYIIEQAFHDITILQNEGIQGILISNEFSFPYTQKLSQITVATMARIIGELKSTINVPFGVDCMYDAFSTIDLAIATDADFYRITLLNYQLHQYELGTTALGDIIRYANDKRCKKSHMILNINYTVNSAMPIGQVKNLINVIATQSRTDVLCLSADSIMTLYANGFEFRSQMPKAISLLCDGGCNSENIINIVHNVDGMIVGTSLKENNDIRKPISSTNVIRFMKTLYTIE